MRVYIATLLHVNFETWRAPKRKIRQNFIASPPPFPRGPHLFGPVTSSIPKRSHVISISGNAQYSDFSLGWHFPFGKFHHGVSFNGSVVNPLGESKLDSCVTPGFDCVDPEGKSAVHIDVIDRFAYLGYKKRLLNNKIDINAKASYFNAIRTFQNYSAVVASSLLPGGMTYSQDYTGYRWSGTLDIGIRFSSNHRLLTGGEVTYEYRPKDYAVFKTYPSSVELLALECPPPNEDGELCKLLHNNAASRIIGAVYIDDQITFGDLVLNGGVRLEAAGGDIGYSPEILFSGAAVYRVIDQTYMKLNFAEGFRPTSFLHTVGSGLVIEWTGNSNLKNERSRSILGQITSTVLRDSKVFNNLTINLGYSYTWVYNFINTIDGLYTNSGDIGISAVEFNTKLNIKGGHWLSLGYSFQDIKDEDRGAFRGLPAQWLSMSLYLKLIKNYLSFSTNVLIIGTSEDPNKWADIASAPVHLGRVEKVNGKYIPVMDDVYKARGSDIVWDRSTPAAVVNIGLQSQLLKEKLRLRVDLYNALDANYYYPDAFFDLATGTEAVSNVAPPFSVFFSASYNL